MKPTPGPWTATKGFTRIERVVATDGKSVASTGNTPSRTSEEREANARLIAAAPDLLSAADAVVRFDHKNGGPSEWNELMRNLESAIAKAEGKVTHET